MSNRKTKNRNRDIRNKYGSVTLKELADKGLVPKNFHLFDYVEMKEYQKKFQTDWWKRMSIP